ncbi:transglutaminase family protein, partial [Acinetobacter baumannii]
LRSERCYLYPGDSPLGYRLPLDSLPWVTEGEAPVVDPAAPTQAFRPLPSSAEIRRQLGSPQEPAALLKKAASSAAAIG